MSRLARLALVVVVLMAAALSLPVAYTAADDEGPRNPSPTPSAAGATPTPSPDVALPSPSEPTPTESETAPTPDPETETSSPTPPAPGPASSALGEEAALDLALSASPPSIEVGEESSIVAEIGNSGDEAAEDVDVIVTLPPELAYLSASPTPSDVDSRRGRTTLEYRGLTVPADGTVTLSISTEGIDDADAALIQGSVLWQGDEITAAATLEITAPPSDLTVDVRGPRALTQVGERVRYDITVTNLGGDAVEEVSIVNLVPREVHVLSVGVPPRIDGVQVGQDGSGAEDVVWTMDEFAPGETIDLSYLGVVESAGDLKAVNETRLLVGPADAGETTENTYLASSVGASAKNPAFEPIVKKKVIRKRVTERSLIRRRVSTTPDDVASGVLPFTGLDPFGAAAVGIALVGAGLVALRLSARRTRPRRLVGAVLVLLIVGSACVSQDPDSALPEGDTRVKGREITRGDDPDDGTVDADDRGGADENVAGDGPDDGEATDDDDGTAVPNDADGDVDEGDDATDTGDGPDADDDSVVDESDDEDETAESETEEVVVLGPPVTRVERRTRLVTITEDDLPLISTESMTGARPVSFGWDDDATALTHSKNSRTVDTQAGVALAVDIAPAGNGMRATVTLDNLGARRRAAVSGSLGLTISGGPGATLRSDPVDVTLNPGGEASATFDFRLPSGTYTAQPSFRAG